MGAGGFFSLRYDFDGDRETEWVLEKCDIRMEISYLTTFLYLIVPRQKQMKVVQQTQKYVRVGLIIALYSADNAVKSIDSAKYTILYSAANGYFWHYAAALNAKVEL